jgi:hypothetical protein
MGFIQTPQKKRIRIKLADTKSLRDARKQHHEWLKSHGLHNIKPRDRSETLVIEPLVDRTGVPCGDKIPVAVKGRAEPQTYSGERKLIGIATMHKSNQVPVFADDDQDGRDKATEISQMRRN